MTRAFSTSRKPLFVSALTALLAAVTLTARQQAPGIPATQQPTEVSTTITGDQPGVAPQLAVPDFIALSADPESREAARTIARVLSDDLNFEREFALIPRDVVATVPPATSMTAVPFDRWRELNVDGVVVGTVQKTSSGFHVEVRIFNVRSRQSAFGMTYDGGASNVRIYAHHASDDIHRQQRGLRGVAQTKITFNSDRSGQRVAGTVENRGVREVLFADYDGENVAVVTANRSLNIASVWSPDGQSIAYTSWRLGPPNIFVANPYKGTGGLLTDGKSQNWLPAWSPDGTQIAFSSMRDGNAEIYVMNRDGSNLRRLTNNQYDDTTPTWSPNGTRIAFTSDRTGSEQIWEMGADGLGQHILSHEDKADRATWSLAPFNEIAFAAMTSPGRYDIKVLDVTTGVTRQLTFGEGSNESPAFAPNGLHIAFTSTRSGKEQVYTMDRTGRNVRQITKGGSNRMPNWSRGPAN
jgi:TolB protein